MNSQLVPKPTSDDDDLFNVIELSSDYDRSTWVGRLIFLWQWRFFIRNYKKEFNLKAIPRGRAKDGAEYVYNEFLKYWEAEVERARKANRQPNLAYAIFRQYGPFLVFLGAFCFLAHYAMIAQALYLDDVIQNYNNLNDGDKSAKHEIIRVCAIIVVLSVIATNAKNVFYYFTGLVTIRLKVCLSQMIYRKSLRLSRSGFDKTSTGQIVNFLSVDMTRVEYFLAVLPYPIVSFVLMTYAVVSLWKTLSHYTLYGLLFLVFVIPVQGYIGKIFSSMRLKAAAYTDERIRLVNEFISAIKIIKLYCWEYPFMEKINKARKKEIAKIKKSLYIYSVTDGLFTSTTKVLVFIILLTFYLSGGEITDRIVFLTLSVFQQTTFMVTVILPNFILNYSNFMITIKRFNKFLTLDEKEDAVCFSSGGKENSLSIHNLTACVDSPTNDDGEDNPAFSDNEEETDRLTDRRVDLLKNINFSCRPGELVIVVGSVGCGKSTLLQAILSELQIKEGTIEVNGKLSYAAQDAWIFGGSIRENILFDSRFDELKYNEVVRACALEHDLGLFEDGDQTLIGEKGISLSGGQKARIGLARALYFDSDVVLLDDPLSAVDAHVSKHIFKNAITGYLKHKTVLLVTHQLNYISYADKVLFLKDGEQILFESGNEVLKRLADQPDDEFARFIGSHLVHENTELTRKLSLTVESVAFDEEEQKNQLKEIQAMEKEKRMQAEDDKVNFVYKAYLSYFKYGSIAFYGPLMVIVFGLTQLNATGCDYFLKLWTDSIKTSHNSTVEPTDDDFVIKLIKENAAYVYSGLILSFFVLGLIRVMVLAMFSMRASVNIHKSLFNRIVRAQMNFFYRYPVGIVLNRFSRDIGIVDDELWGTFYDFLVIIINNLAIAIVMGIANPWLLLPFSVFVVTVVSYRVFYIHTARVLQTLGGVCKSPIIQHLASTLNGLSTVRAFKSEGEFIKKFNRVQNDNTAVVFTTGTAQRWFINFLENIQILFVGSLLLVLVLFAEHFSGSLIGFILTNVLLMTVEFQWGISCWSRVETNLCSVDRIDTIGRNLDPSSKEGESLAEPALESSESCRPPSGWPRRGEIEFRNVTLRYFRNDSPALKDLNFKIEDGEKIGIVGRTGSGKSSCLAALFRLNDYDGEIIIDGINCKTIGLHDLRDKISIIPQEAILFTGTVRSNLDPLEKYSDHQLWEALRSVQLEQVILELEGGLDAKVMDSGSNFSVGQKQLICLARAILKRSKILVMDEATANTDPSTDELIQATIRTVFKEHTILTIAHRINTVLDSTRILVMDEGEVREFDTPSRLLADGGSLFSSMVDAYGEEQSKILRRMVKADEK